MSAQQAPYLSTIISSHNEGAVFQTPTERTDAPLINLSKATKSVLLDAGHYDNTASIKRAKYLHNNKYEGIFFSRKRDHPLPLFSGLHFTKVTSTIYTLEFSEIYKFSNLPFRFITTKLTLFILLITIIYLSVSLNELFFTDTIPLPIATLIIAIVLFSSIQLISSSLISKKINTPFSGKKNTPTYISKII